MYLPVIDLWQLFIDPGNEGSSGIGIIGLDLSFIMQFVEVLLHIRIKLSHLRVQ